MCTSGSMLVEGIRLDLESWLLKDFVCEQCRCACAPWMRGART